MKHRGSAVMIGIAVLALASCPAFAEETREASPSTPSRPLPVETPQPALTKLLPERMTAAKTLTLAVALGAPPDDFRDADGEAAGWEIDILRAATQALGLQLELRPTTFDTIIPGLQSHRFDAAVGQMGVSEVREKVIDMIGTLKGNEAFAALSTSNIKVNSLADLCGVKVATTRGSREFEYAQNYQPQCAAAGRQPIDIQVFSDGNGASEALMSQRSELFWLGSTTVDYFVSQSKGRAKVVGTYTDLSYIGVGLPKGSDLSGPLQAAIQHLVDDGTYKAIVTKWGLENGAVATVPLNPTGTPR